MLQHNITQVLLRFKCILLKVPRHTPKMACLLKMKAPASVKGVLYDSNTLQHTATHCSTLQHTATQYEICDAGFIRLLQHPATPCNTLQHPATHYKMIRKMYYLDCTTTATHSNTLQHTATHSNTLQRTATHYKTLQHNRGGKFDTETTRLLQCIVIHCNTLQHIVTRVEQTATQ